MCAQTQFNTSRVGRYTSVDSYSVYTRWIQDVYTADTECIHGYKFVSSTDTQCIQQQVGVQSPVRSLGVCIDTSTSQTGDVYTMDTGCIHGYKDVSLRDTRCIQIQSQSGCSQIQSYSFSTCRDTSSRQKPDVYTMATECIRDGYKVYTRIQVRIRERYTMYTSIRVDLDVVLRLRCV